MTFEPQPISDRELDVYLDGLLQPAEKEAFERRLRAEPEVARQVELQRRVDDSLQKLFPPQAVSPQQIESIVASRSETMPKRVRPSARPWSRAARVALVGLAAGLAWIVVGWQLREEPPELPFFEPRPLVAVYQETIESGFEPYYECRESDRFASTFLRRQGKALHLAALPEGSRMLGLSYTGGLSRDTTAMLCEVNEQPVMVFVDRIENDQPLAAKSPSAGVHVHRDERNGLVFYEVSPFEQPSMYEFMRFAPDSQ